MARSATGEERERLRREMLERYPGINAYEGRAAASARSRSSF